MRKSSERTSAIGQVLEDEESLATAIAASIPDDEDDEEEFVEDIDEPAWESQGTVLAGQSQREKDRLKSINSDRQLGPIEEEKSLERHKDVGIDLKELLKVKPQPVVGYDDMNLGPMGEATPRYGGCVFPAVEATAVGPGKFRLRQVTAKHAAGHDLKLVPVGTYDLGVILAIKEGVVSTSSEHARFLEGASADWKGCRLFRGVNAEAYREIQLRELEHLVDFAYAFKLATQPVVDAVEQLKGTDFPNADAALEAIVAALRGKHLALVPQSPRSPRAWQERGQFVAKELASLSSARDDPTTGTHRPLDYQATKKGTDVVMVPRFKPGSLPTAQIILLDGVKIVFQGLKTYDRTPKSGALCKMTQNISTRAHDSPAGQALANGRLSLGDTVKIDRKASGDTLWVAAQAEQSGVTKPKIPKDAVLYFEVPIDSLVEK